MCPLHLDGQVGKGVLDQFMIFAPEGQIENFWELHYAPSTGKQQQLPAKDVFEFFTLTNDLDQVDVNLEIFGLVSGKLGRTSTKTK